MELDAGAQIEVVKTEGRFFRLDRRRKNRPSVSQGYTIVWRNWDKSVLEIDEEVEAGTIPTYNGKTPERKEDERYRYVFRTWSPSVSEAKKDTNYFAMFTEIDKYAKYTVTWKNWDGSILETDKDVAEGSMPEYNGNTPKRPDDSQYTYVFKRWNPSLKKVTGNAIYTAEFTSVKKAAIADGGGSTSGGGAGGGGGSSSGGSGGGGGSSSGGSGGGSAGGPGAKSTVVAGAPTFSKNWVADAAGVWRIRDKAGNYVTSAWLCDDAVTTNGENVWYLMNTDGTMLAAGLVQDNTGNYYSLEMNHNGYYGMLRYVNGTYDGIYMEFNRKHDGTFGAITNQSAIDALKAKYGVTRFGIGNDRCVYTKSFE